MVGSVTRRSVMRSPGVILLVVVGLVVVSCGGGESTGTTSPAGAAIAASPTASVASTTTPTSTQQTESDVGPFPAGEPVDLLVMTDSSGWGIAERLAPLAADALDREVRVRDWARGGEPITNILEWVQTILADEVAEAEIIVMYGYPGGLEYELPEPSLLSCFEAADAVVEPEEYTGDWTPGTRWEPTPVVPTTDDWRPYRDVLDQLYDEIWELRAGKPTIIRTYDVPLGLIGPWKELGIEAECTANWEVQFQVVREAAEANGAGFVSVLDIFNGPNRDEDPLEKGWMSGDLMHPEGEGWDIIAELLAAYGFEPGQPSG